MSIDNDINVLGKLDIFRSLDYEQLRILAFGAERRAYIKDQLIFNECDNADCAFLVLAGQVDLYRHRGNSMQYIQSVEPGSLIGELALLAQTTRPVSAYSVNHATLLRISRSSFQRLLEEFPKTAENLIEYVQSTLHQLVEDISRLAPEAGNTHK